MAAKSCGVGNTVTTAPGVPEAPGYIPSTGAARGVIVVGATLETLVTLVTLATLEKRGAWSMAKDAGSEEGEDAMGPRRGE